MKGFKDGCGIVIGITDGMDFKDGRGLLIGITDGMILRMAVEICHSTSQSNNFYLFFLLLISSLMAMARI